MFSSRRQTYIRDIPPREISEPVGVDCASLYTYPKKSAHKTLPIRAKKNKADEFL